MLDRLGSLMSSYPTEGFQVPGAPVLPEQNWWGKFKDWSVPAAQGGGGGLERLAILADTIGANLNRAKGLNVGTPAADFARGSIASKAAKDRQSQWNQLLSQLIGGMTPGTNPGGNSLKISPIEGGGSKLTYDHTIGKDGEGAEGLGTLSGPVTNPDPASWMGNAMKNFPFY